jgi:L-aminopeptidase/D-esterase-like protein
VSLPQLLSAYAGHWTGPGTGVTVIVPPAGTVASGEVRGGAPATREFALLDPVCLVDRVDAVVLSGGSAFGLSAAHGVMTALRDRGQGFATPLGPVPIVVGMSIFDGSVAGTPPDAVAGARAFGTALSGAPFTTGAAGAGTGATTGKWRGRLDPGGVGVAHGTAGSASIVAVVVVNAWGDVLAPDGTPLLARDGEPLATPDATAVPFGASPSAVSRGDAGSPGVAPAVSRGDAGSPGVAPAVPRGPAAATGALSPGAAGLNTTIGVLLTDARLGKNDCYLLAQSGHTGYARAIHPAHSRYDGDAVVALATGEGADADLDMLRAVATETMAAAIRNAVFRA